MSSFTFLFAVCNPAIGRGGVVMSVQTVKLQSSHTIDVVKILFYPQYVYLILFKKGLHLCTYEEGQRSPTKRGMKKKTSQICQVYSN